MTIESNPHVALNNAREDAFQACRRLPIEDKNFKKAVEPLATLPERIVQWPHPVLDRYRELTRDCIDAIAGGGLLAVCGPATTCLTRRSNHT
jgi:hypothetical protein